MSDNTEKKPVSFRFQRFICVGYVLSEPELKVHSPRAGETEGTPYCRCMVATGTPYGERSDAVFTVLLKGKNATLFCKEPRKGKEFLFDLQLRTYNVQKEGQQYPDRRTEFVGSFNFIGPKEKTDGTGQTELPKQTTQPSPTKAQKEDDDVPF